MSDDNMIFNKIDKKADSTEKEQPEQPHFKKPIS